VKGGFNKKEMRFNFKKISAITTSILLAGMTLGVAAAASYPAPFVENGASDVAIVYGTGSGVSYLDTLHSTKINDNLRDNVGVVSSGTTSSVSGEAAELWSGSDRIYLGDELGDGGVTQLTKDDLPTILADGIFDNGQDNDYSQRIEMGATTNAEFTFDDSGSDLDDPSLIIDLGTSTTTPIFDFIVDFDTATTFNSTDAEGEQITLFGKEYTISTETDGDEIYLFESSQTISLSIAGDDPASTEVTIDGESYTVTLKGATSTQAHVQVTDSSGTSDSKEVSEGSSSKINGVEIGVNIATTSEALGQESAEIMIGADKIKLKDGDEVKIGSGLDGIDGTLVDLTPNTNTEILTQIKISVTADDNDNDHLAVGDSFTDPVFGAVKLSFAGIKNGPDLSAGESDTNTERSKIEVVRDTNSALEVTMTDKNGNTATVPFAFDDTPASDGTDQKLGDKDEEVIYVVEGADVSDDEAYVLLNSNGEYVALGEIKTMDNTDCTTTDLTIEDVFTGEDIVDWDDQVVDATKTFTYKGKTFTVGCGDGAALNISDATTGSYNVYPFVELFSGYDHKVAFTEDVTIWTDWAPANGDARNIILPTGTVTLTVAENTTDGGTDCTFTFSGTGVTATAGTIAVDETDGDDFGAAEVSVGSMDYIFGFGDATDNACVVDVSIQVDSDAADSSPGEGTDGSALATAIGAIDGSTDHMTEATQAGLLIVGEEDATNSDAKEAVYIEVDDSGTTSYYLETEAPIFTATEVSASFDADGRTGYIDPFGTYALRDTDGDQDLVEVTLPKTQMYAEVYLSEESAVVTAGTSGGSSSAYNGVVISDKEVSSYSSKNLIIVGGSCINSAAATLVGGAYCGTDWTDATSAGPGKFLIKSYPTSTLTSKMALLVAGYGEGDTANAATYLRTQTVDTSKEYLGSSSTSAEVVVEGSE